MKRILFTAIAALMAGCGPQTIHEGSGGVGSGIPSGVYQGTASSTPPPETSRTNGQPNTGTSSTPTGTNTFGTRTNAPDSAR